MTKTIKQHSHRISPRAVLGTALLLSSVTAFAGEPAEPLELRKIMQQMGRDMQTIVDGISREDWALVAQTAPKIADHPKPPMSERMRIIGFIGSDAPRFKGFDGETHDTARELAEIAASGNGMAVIDKFNSLQKTCLNCHQSFRKPLQRHFYGDAWGEDAGGEPEKTAAP